MPAGSLGRLETSRTAGPSGLHLLPPPSTWPHLRRATPATWQSGFTFRGSSLTAGSRAAVGRSVSGRTALTRDGSLALDDDLAVLMLGTHSIQRQAAPGWGSAREQRSAVARSAASAGASADDQSASWLGSARWDATDVSENGAGPRGTATAARGPEVGGDGAATAVVTPGSARDLLRSTLNAIDVLQSPFKAHDMGDEDKRQDDSVHIEHGLASASVGRAVYEVCVMVGCTFCWTKLGACGDKIIVCTAAPVASVKPLLVALLAYHLVAAPSESIEQALRFAMFRAERVCPAQPLCWYPVGPPQPRQCSSREVMHPARPDSEPRKTHGSVWPWRSHHSCALSAQVLRISPQGKQRRIYVKRRDLLRSNGLLPRDLRRIDPTLSVTKTSPAISIKEHVLLVNLGGVRCATYVPKVTGSTSDRTIALLTAQANNASHPVCCLLLQQPANPNAMHCSQLKAMLAYPLRRLIVGAEKCLLFEPSSPCSRKFLELISPRLQVRSMIHAKTAVEIEPASISFQGFSEDHRKQHAHTCSLADDEGMSQPPSARLGAQQARRTMSAA